MRLAFLRATTPLEKMLAQGSEHWHSAVQFTDGWWGSSRPRGGVFLEPHQGVGELHDYDFIVTDLTDLEETQVREWFVRHSGDKYDWSAFLGGKDNAEREYCTEAVVLSFQHAGRFKDLEASKQRASGWFYEVAQAAFPVPVSVYSGCQNPGCPKSW